MKMLTKTKVAEELGISASTLIRYVRRGVVPEPMRHPVNGWRIWSQAEVDQIAKVIGQGSGAGGWAGTTGCDREGESEM